MLLPDNMALNYFGGSDSESDEEGLIKPKDLWVPTPAERKKMRKEAREKREAELAAQGLPAEGMEEDGDSGKGKGKGKGKAKKDEPDSDSERGEDEGVWGSGFASVSLCSHAHTTVRATVYAQKRLCG